MSNFSSIGRLTSQLQAVAASMRQFYPQTSQRRFNIWEVVQIVALCILLPGFWYLRRKREESKSITRSSMEPSIDHGKSNGSASVTRKVADVNG